MKNRYCRHVRKVAITLFFLSNLCLGQIHISGEIDGTLIDTIYIVDGDIEVNGLLTIEPGAVLMFDDGVQFDVNGHIDAVGTVTDSIYFILNQGAESWGGIDLNDGSFWGCTFAYCYISGSNSSGLYCADFSYPLISNCVFTNNSSPTYGGGLQLISFHPDTIRNCIFDNNSNGGIYITIDSDPIFYECVFSNNTGSGIILNVSQAEFHNCLIYGNFSSDDGGGILVLDNGWLNLKRCVIYNNSSQGKGGGIYTENTPYLTNCTLALNSAEEDGNAIYLITSAGIANCLIYNNYGSDNAMYMQLAIAVHIDYCNLYNEGVNNFDGTFLPDDLGVINYLNSNGDSCDYYSNIYLDPNLLNPDGSDFSLSSLSPCIDAGHPDSLFDPDGTVSDIGAFFYDQNNFIDKPGYSMLPENFKILSVYPNPFNSSTRIQLSIPRRTDVSVDLFNILGKKIVSLGEFEYSGGNHFLSLDANNLPSGTYFVRASTPKFQSSIHKIQLVK